jgi:hypothetical protein
VLALFLLVSAFALVTANGAQCLSKSQRRLEAANNDHHADCSNCLGDRNRRLHDLLDAYMRKMVAAGVAVALAIGAAVT